MNSVQFGSVSKKYVNSSDPRDNSQKHIAYEREFFEKVVSGLTIGHKRGLRGTVCNWINKLVIAAIPTPIRPKQFNVGEPSYNYFSKWYVRIVEGDLFIKCTCEFKSCKICVLVREDSTLLYVYPYGGKKTIINEIPITNGHKLFEWYVASFADMKWVTKIQDAREYPN